EGQAGHTEPGPASLPATDGSPWPHHRAVLSFPSINNRNGWLAQPQTGRRSPSSIEILPDASDARRDANRVRVRAVLGSTVGPHAVPRRRGRDALVTVGRCVGGLCGDFLERSGNAAYV